MDFQNSVYIGKVDRIYICFYKKQDSLAFNNSVPQTGNDVFDLERVSREC